MLTQTLTYAMSLDELSDLLTREWFGPARDKLTQDYFRHSKPLNSDSVREVATGLGELAENTKDSFRLDTLRVELTSDAGGTLVAVSDTEQAGLDHAVAAIRKVCEPVAVIEPAPEPEEPEPSESVALTVIEPQVVPVVEDDPSSPVPREDQKQAMIARMRAGELLLGFNLATHDYILLSQTDQTRHALILGKTGTGKSNLTTFMVRQTIAHGHGCCVIDPFGQLTESILNDIPYERAEDVVLLDLSDIEHPFGINIFEPGTTPADVTALFQKVWGGTWGTLVQKWLSAITYTFTEAGEGTLADVSRLFSNAAYRNRLLRKVRNFQALSDWERAPKKDGAISDQETGSTANRISLFLYDAVLLNIVGQQQSTVDFKQLVADKKIILCKLAAENQETQSLIGTLIMQKLTKALIGTYRDHHFFVYCDEFQRFATPDMIKILSGGRQFHVGMFLATQNLAQVRDEFVRDNLQNVGTTIAFTLTAEDAGLVSKTLKKIPRGVETPIPRADSYQALMNYEHGSSIGDEVRTIEKKILAIAKGSANSDVEIARHHINRLFIAMTIRNSELVEYSLMKIGEWLTSHMETEIWWPNMLGSGYDNTFWLTDSGRKIASRWLLLYSLDFTRAFFARDIVKYQELIDGGKQAITDWGGGVEDVFVLTIFMNSARELLLEIFHVGILLYDAPLYEKPVEVTPTTQKMLAPSQVLKHSSAKVPPPSRRSLASTR